MDKPITDDQHDLQEHMRVCYGEENLTLPVSTTLDNTSTRTNNRPEQDVHTFSPCLASKSEASLIRQVLVPAGSRVNACWECGNKIRATDTVAWLQVSKVAEDIYMCESFSPAFARHSPGKPRRGTAATWPAQPVVGVMPPVKLTFSSSVICDTKALALVMALSHSPVASCSA